MPDIFTFTLFGYNQEECFYFKPYLFGMPRRMPHIFNITYLVCEDECLIF